MKTKSLLILSTAFLAAGVLGYCAVDRDSKKPNHPAPELKVDNSALARGASGVVTSYADVIEPVQKAVVSVYSSKTIRQQIAVDPFLRDFFYGGKTPELKRKVAGLGSGVVVTSNGYILTNNHVVDGADELKVMLTDGREMTATVIGTDPKTDVAVIKIDAKDLACVTLADSDQLRVGDVVFAVGNPLNVGQTVTMGIVSATGRSNLGILEDTGGYESFIQTDAAINPGNSGGALVDAKGRLVGINTAIYSSNGANIGIGFAIPVNLASSIMHSLIETGEVQRGFLGITSDPENPGITPDQAEAIGLPRDTRGVYVTNITPDGPADKAGLKRNDVITAVDGKKIAVFNDLRNYIASKLPGTEITLDYLRDGKARSVKVTLTTLDEKATATGLLDGVTLQPLTQDQRQALNAPDDLEGLAITRVADDSPYADRLASGMVIVEINREPARTVDDASKLLKSGRNLLLVYYRGFYRPIVLTMK